MSTLFTGIELFPANSKAFLEFGQTIVSDTGDRDLRERLEQASKGAQ